MKYWLHAEDIGWPLKKTGKQTNADSKVAGHISFAEPVLAAA